MATNFADWNKDTERMIEFTDKALVHLVGKRLPILAATGFPNFAITFDAKIDINTLDVISRTEPEYKKSTLPTINDLVAAGVMKEWFPYRQESLNHGERFCLADGNLDIIRIIKHFRHKGFNVSEKAIRHNYNAWCQGYKSGYRDKVNNVHVFTPCGDLNPFNIHVTELNNMCTDWQKTYVC